MQNLKLEEVEESKKAEMLNNQRTFVGTYLAKAHKRSQLFNSKAVLLAKKRE